MNNVATKNEGNDDLFGGSAILLYTVVGLIKKCKFRNNELKIVDNLEANSNSMILQVKKSSFKVTECDFSVNKNSKFAIFYHNGDKNIKSTLELEKCIFNGQLNNNAYFIDGNLIDKNLLNLIINDCKFPCKLKKALNPKSKFKLTEIKNNNSKEMKFISAFAVFGVALVAIIAILLTKKLNKSNYSDDQKEEEIEI